MTNDDGISEVGDSKIALIFIFLVVHPNDSGGGQVDDDEVVMIFS